MSVSVKEKHDMQALSFFFIFFFFRWGFEKGLGVSFSWRTPMVHSFNDSSAAARHSYVHFCSLFLLLPCECQHV